MSTPRITATTPDTAPPAAADSSALLHLRLLGAPTIGRPGSTPHALERKDAALLAVLAIEGMRGRDELATWLWPSATAKTAAGSLRQRIFRLRRRLDHEVVQAGERLRLLPDIVTDLQPPPDAADPDEPPLLDGCDYADCAELAAWVGLQRDRRRRQRLERLGERMADLEAQGELGAALALAVRISAEEPVSERAQRQVMRLHYLRGDRAAAIESFERFERLLKDDLGARPGAETLALLATIEGGAPVALPARRPEVPASLQRPPRLVGRRAELSAMAEAWASGHVFLLVGEAGMGKSRLLAEWAATPQAARGVQVAARPGDAGVPYALLARLLRAVFERVHPPSAEDTRRELARVLPEWSAGRPVGEAQRLVLQRAVEEALGSAPREGVDALLLDDLHFADAASLELLQGVIAHEPADASSAGRSAADGLRARPGARPQPLLWGLAQRTAEEHAPTGQLRDALVDTQRLREIALKPLDVTAMTELVASLGLPELDATALAAPLVRHTGGNPLFALETLKDMLLRGVSGGRLPQPATVGALVERRLRTLSPDALALARVAAIAGIDFSIELAEAVLQRPALALADAWAELQTAQVLSGSAFAHDLVFEAVLRSVPEAIARHGHAAVAEVLAARDREPARIAAHWEAARRWPEAAAMLARAASLARLAGRVGDALGLCRRAVAAHDRAGDAAARWRAECDSIELVLMAEGSTPARALAERLLGEAADRPQRMAALTGLALTCLMAGDAPGVLKASEEALALGEAGEDDPLLFDARRLRAHALAQTGRAAEAAADLRARQAAVDAAGSLRQRYELRSALAYALNLDSQPLACSAVLREVIELANAAGDLAEVMSSLVNLAASELVTGHAARALAHARAARALGERVGTPDGPHAAINDMNAAVMAAQVGQLGEALVELEGALARLVALGGPVWAANARNHLAALWLTLGQPHRVNALIDDPQAASQPVIARRRALLRARIAQLQPGADRAGIAARLEAEIAACGTGAVAKDAAALHLELSRLVEPARALALVRAVQHEAEPAGLAGLALHGRMREIDLLLSTDPAQAAARAATLEGDAADLVPIGGYLPELWLVAARAARAVGDGALAQARTARGLAWVEAAAAGLPAGLRGMFLTANPVNHALRQEQPPDPAPGAPRRPGRSRA